MRLLSLIGALLIFSTGVVKANGTLDSNPLTEIGREYHHKYHYCDCEYTNSGGVINHIVIYVTRDPYSGEETREEVYRYYFTYTPSFDWCRSFIEHYPKCH